MTSSQEGAASMTATHAPTRIPASASTAGQDRFGSARRVLLATMDLTLKYSGVPARWVVRRPGLSAALAAAVVATSPVTFRHVTAVVVGYGFVSGYGHIRGATHPAGELSLPDVAIFRKRTRALRRRWVTVMTDTGLVKAPVNGGQAKRMPKIRKVVPTPLGLAVFVDGSPVSAGPADFREKADKLRHGFRCRDIKITNAGPNTVRLDLRWDDPFRQPIRFADLPPAKRLLHITVGLDEDGQPVSKDLRLPNLIVGAKGSGKSNEVWTVLAALVKAGIPFRLRMFDPKGGQEFTELEDAAWQYERNPGRWSTFLEGAHRALAARQADLRRRKVRDLTRFTDECPLDVMVIDELLSALAFGAGSQKVKVDGKQIKSDDAFMVYLATCRSAGHTVLALSQLGQKEIIGPVRGQFDYATCLRVGQTEKELVDIMLGVGASKAFPAHELSTARGDAGIGYMRTETGVSKYRAARLSDTERANLVEAVRKMTVRLRAARGVENAEDDE